jgi:hypothetical protein
MSEEQTKTIKEPGEDMNVPPVKPVEDLPKSVNSAPSTPLLEVVFNFPLKIQILPSIAEIDVVKVRGNISTPAPKELSGDDADKTDYYKLSPTHIQIAGQSDWVNLNLASTRLCDIYVSKKNVAFMIKVTQ